MSPVEVQNSSNTAATQQQNSSKTAATQQQNSSKTAANCCCCEEEEEEERKESLTRMVSCGGGLAAFGGDDPGCRKHCDFEKTCEKQHRKQPIGCSAADDDDLMQISCKFFVHFRCFLKDSGAGRCIIRRVASRARRCLIFSSFRRLGVSL